MKKVEKSSGNQIEPAHERSKINHSRSFYIHTSERMWRKVKRIVLADDNIPDMASFARLAIINEINRRGHVFIDDRPIVWKTPPVFRLELVRLILDEGRMIDTLELAEMLGIKRGTIAGKLRRLEEAGILVREIRRKKLLRLNRYQKMAYRMQHVAFWGIHSDYMPKRKTKDHSGYRRSGRPRIQHG